ncbi:MAG: hypothetical protein ACYYK0_06900 [Candidatus Eutrophobiaceae bacterium]
MDLNKSGSAGIRMLSVHPWRGFLLDCHRQQSCCILRVFMESAIFDENGLHRAFGRRLALSTSKELL